MQHGGQLKFQREAITFINMATVELGILAALGGGYEFYSFWDMPKCIRSRR
jgi:hypothetical protein